jgi:hypothetical protein
MAWKKPSGWLEPVPAVMYLAALSHMGIALEDVRHVYRDSEAARTAVVSWGLVCATVRGRCAPLRQSGP